MSGIATAVVASAVIGGVVANNSAKKAAGAQDRAEQGVIAESQRQFDSIRELLKPYNDTGTDALTGQRNLLGLNGNEAQSGAISGIANGQQFQAMQQQGENSMLQNAAATGGLRGGNLQGALAQFRPQLLNQLIQQQYGNLGGLVSVGQNAAAGVGNAGQRSSDQIINSMQQQGAAQAGMYLAQGQAQQNTINGIGKGLGMYLGKF